MVEHEDTRAMAAELSREIARLVGDRPVRFMEVCGTHTVAIFRAGIRQLLPPNVEVVAGPGCPVCVTPCDYMDRAIAYARQSDVIVATFGDMLRVPGSTSSLQEAAARGADVRVVYSPLDALAIAEARPEKKVVFLAVGFETTSPTAAAAVLEAARRGVENFFVLSAHKLVPPALRALIEDGDARVDGFLLPGHVCAVAGEAPFRFIAKEFDLPAVVGGFTPLEIMRALGMLTRQLDAAARLENAYAYVAKPEGNPAARRVLEEVYEVTDAAWRGIGIIKDSGLCIRSVYRHFDAETVLPLALENAIEPHGCRCGEVLRGRIRPVECGLFARVCTPDHPVGACMVSVEGACAAWHKYGSGRYRWA